jgi:hypothetical protein
VRRDPTVVLSPLADIPNEMANHDDLLRALDPDCGRYLPIIVYFLAFWFHRSLAVDVSSAATWQELLQ